MWLTRLVWLLLLLATVNSQDPLPCDAIVRTMHFVNDINVCTVTTNTLLLGHPANNAILDFSKADEGVLNTFLKQFTKIRAAIVMDGNEMITSLDLSTVEQMTVNTFSIRSFIRIRNNLQLQSIKFHQGLDIITNNATRILVYNNPRLEADAIFNLNQALNRTGYPIEGTIQQQGECQVTHLPDSQILTFLHHCKSVKGDFILKGGAPDGAIQLTGGGCLSLTDVDLTSYKITFSVNSTGTGVEECKDGSVSTIWNNPGLCEPKITELAGYFPNILNSNIRIQPHPSCAVDCTISYQIWIVLLPCRTVNGIINIWFSNMLPGLKYKTELLESSSKQLNITKSDEVIYVHLPKLTSVNEFTIADNLHLSSLDLPKLSTAETLRISGNGELASLVLQLESVEKRLEITGNRDLTHLKFPQLKSVETLIISEHQSLKELNWPLLTDVDNLILTETGHLLYHDVMKLLEHFKPKQLFVIDCNPGGMTFTAASQLTYCTNIKGQLILEDFKEDLPADALKHIWLIDGCIIVRNTQFTNIAFLEKIPTNCRSAHVLENNPHLCPVGKLNGVEVRTEGEFKKRCYNESSVAVGNSTVERKICYDKLAPKCIKAVGNIVITSETPTRHYEVLEVINGSLSIVGTDMRTLIIPILDEISGTKGPLLRIVNNDELSMVKMPALETVKLVGKGRGPLVEIHSNLMLNVPPNALHFLPDEIYDACFDGQEEICIYDGKRQHYEWTFTKAAIMMVCLSLYLALFCGCLYLCCRQERREIQQMRERSHVVAERMATPKRGGSMSPIPKSLIQSANEPVNESKMLPDSRKSLEPSAGETSQVNSQPK